ncbi:MAG: hypothetical protein M0R80_23740 [Proteobacteria bacterium]|jgi:hypothetical protein|nr:hypothetical protein [Pseudomonadota bacterium]
MSAVAESIANFPKVVAAHTTACPKDATKAILAQIDKVKNTNPKIFNKNALKDFLEQRSQILDKLLDQWFTATVSRVFPLIDENMFKLQRHLLFQKVGKAFVLVKDETDAKDAVIEPKKKCEPKVGKVLQTTLFVYTPLFTGSHKVKLGSFKHKTDDWNYSTVQVTAKLPGEIGGNLQKTYRDAVSKIYRLFAEFYSSPIVGDLLPLTMPFEVGAIWIPNHDSLSVKTTITKKVPIDPAMVLKFRGKTFLIKMWKVDQEEPIEYFLREFTDQPLSDLLKD